MARAIRLAGIMSMQLLRVAKKAFRDPRARFTSLAHLLDEGALERAYHRLRGSAAVGVDGVTKEDYGKKLGSNLQDLLRRLKEGRYRHQPIRRVHIPKGAGKTRPLGISTVEDKVVQGALRDVLEAIYEQDFLVCSYGFRRGLSAHDALRALDRLAFRKPIGWILEADIQSYFDSLDRPKLKEMIEKRVADGRLLRLIGKCLHVGVLDGEEFTRPSEGTAQGSVMTPPTQRATSSSRPICLTSAENDRTVEDDIRGSMFMTFEVVSICHGRRPPSKRRPSGAAPQRGSRVAGFRLDCPTGQPTACWPTSYLREASPPVRRAGARSRARRGANRQDRVHREASDRPRSAGQAAGPSQWADDQRVGRAGVDRVLGAASNRLPRWVSGASSSNTSSIASAVRTLPKHIGCSFPSGRD